MYDVGTQSRNGPRQLRHRRIRRHSAHSQPAQFEEDVRTSGPMTNVCAWYHGVQVLLFWVSTLPTQCHGHSQFILSQIWWSILFHKVWFFLPNAEKRRAIFKLLVISTFSESAILEWLVLTERKTTFFATARTPTTDPRHLAYTPTTLVEVDFSSV